MSKQPMSPAEFDAACREMESTYPEISLTSGRRSEERNAEVDGNPASKHLIGMARDYASTVEDGPAYGFLDKVGLWWKPYDWGIHVQGLPPGDVPEWWEEKYGR